MITIYGITLGILSIYRGRKEGGGDKWTVMVAGPAIALCNIMPTLSVIMIVVMIFVMIDLMMVVMVVVMIVLMTIVIIVVMIVLSHLIIVLANVVMNKTKMSIGCNCL